MLYWKTILYQNKKNKTLIHYSTKISWFTKYSIWQMCYLGFYFDELFAHFISTVSYKLLILPGLFLFDKIISPWMGTTILKKLNSNITNIIFFENMQTLKFLPVLLLSFLIFFNCFLILSIC